jgi:hypothetical protein
MTHKRKVQSVPDEPEQPHSYEQEKEAVNKAMVQVITQRLQTGTSAWV